MSLFDGLFSGTNMSDDARGTTATALQALGAGLLSGDRYQPIGPGFSQTLALAQKGSPKAALKQILMQAGYSEADAEKLSANEAVAKLAIDQKREEGFGNLVNGAFGVGSGAGVAPSAPRMSPAAPAGPAAGVSLNGDAATSFLNTLIGKESGGNATAKNPNSSATGLTQFTSGTWDQMMQQHPELGLTPDGRTDPEQAKKAALAYARDNAAELGKSGHEATPGNLYLGHFLGGGGATRFLNGLRNNPNASAASYADPSAVAANRSVFYNPDGSAKSAQAFYNERTSRFGGGVPVQTADASARAGGPPTANDGTAIQTEVGPVAFTPSMTPGPAGQPQQANPADLPNTGAQPVGFNVPPAPGSQPAQQPANATQNAARIRLQNEVNQTLSLIARTGMYGDRGKALAEALKLKIQPLQKFLEPTDIERTLAAADAASPEAAAIIRNSITDARPTSVREFEYARGTPGFEEYQRRMAEAGRSTVTIGGAEKAYDSEQGKTYAELMKEVQAAGRNASTRIANLSEARRLLDTPGFVSGIGTDRFALPAKQLIAKLGGDPNAPANMETFRALSNKAVTDALGGSLGAGVSNADVAFLQRQNTSLDNSIAANKQLIDYATRLTERQTKVAEFARDYAKKNGDRLNVGYDQALAEWAAANPVFPEARSEGQSGQQGQRQPPPQMNTTDRALSLRNARNALKANPGARDVILQRLKDAGLPTDGL